jgi:hypothetical protein
MMPAMSSAPEPLTVRTTVRPSPRVYARPFGDEIVLLDFGLGEYFGLDAVGGEVWKGVEKGLSISDIADAVAAQFDVTRDRALEDILALVGELRANALIEVAASER